MAQEGSLTGAATLIVTGANVITMDPADSRAQAILIREGQDRMQSTGRSAVSRFGHQGSQSTIVGGIYQLADQTPHASLGAMNGDGDHASASRSRTSIPLRWSA